MPSKTEKQARLMRAVAHGWKKPGGGGPSKAVAKEFVAADKKKRQFSNMPKINRQDTRHGKLDLPVHNLRKFAGMKNGGKVRKFAEGGWSTSVSFDPEDAARRAEQWAKDHPPKAKVKATPKPAPKVETTTVSKGPSSRYSAKNTLSIGSKGPSSRYSAKNAPKPTLDEKIAGGMKSPSSPKAFEGARQIRDSLSSTKLDEKIASSMKSPKPPKAGSGWESLKNFLRKDAESKATRNAGMKAGGRVRGDGCATKGKTKGRFC